MTDKQLLIFAAKAYGLKGYEYVDIWGCMARRLEDGSFDSSTCWNPIDSDSDAVRLAVALRILCVDLGRFTIDCTKATTEEARKVITLAAANIAKYARN